MAARRPTAIEERPASEASPPGRRRGSGGALRGGAGEAAAAVARFLDAVGLPPQVRRASELAQTPRRVAEAWIDDLLDGYRIAPADVLADAIDTPSRDLVAVTGIDFHSVCPHHLLPSRGVAHVAYLPGGRVVGFGQLVRLVDCLAHRLVLQEDLARTVAEALVEHLGARGAACVIDAEQLCMTVRGERRPRARAHAEAFAGALLRDRAARRRFEHAIARAGAPEAPPRRTRAARERGGGGRR